MGDNIYLGDRNGVRTPMQWSGDRNAGFSRADPAQLYAPVIMDPVYGYQAINVEAQERSLLAAALDEAADRAAQAAPGVRPRRARVRRVLQPQGARLRAPRRRRHAARRGQPTEFPRIDEGPYFLTLGPYGFYVVPWPTRSRRSARACSRRKPPSSRAEALPALLAGVVWDTLLDGSMRTIVERQALVRDAARGDAGRAGAGDADGPPAGAASAHARAAAGRGRSPRSPAVGRPEQHVGALRHAAIMKCSAASSPARIPTSRSASSSPRAGSRACRRSWARSTTCTTTARSRRRSRCCRSSSNQGNGWEVTIEALGRYFERVTTLRRGTRGVEPVSAWIFTATEPTPRTEVVEAIGTYLAMAEVLGRRTGELHVELATRVRRPGLRARDVLQRPSWRRRRPPPCASTRSRRCGCSSEPRPAQRRNQELAHQVLRHRGRTARAIRPAARRCATARPHPVPRRLSSRSGARHRGRHRHPRLRGRAGAPAGRAAAQDVAAARRGRHAAIVQLRGRSPARRVGAHAAGGSRPDRWETVGLPEGSVGNLGEARCSCGRI
jgi:hypothetical protein